MCGDDAFEQIVHALLLSLRLNASVKVSPPGGLPG
jgi:hypothetical protein